MQHYSYYLLHFMLLYTTTFLLGLIGAIFYWYWESMTEAQLEPIYEALDKGW